LGKFNLPWPLDNDESALEQLRDGSNMFERKTYEIKLALARLFKYFPEIRDVDLSQVLNSNKGLYLLKPNGMIKRTISIKINNQHCHLVAYQDSTQGNDRYIQSMNKYNLFIHSFIHCILLGASLASPYPKDIPLLSGLQISDQLYKYSNLRCPVKQKFESKITQAASTQSSPRLSSQVQSDSACTSEQHSHNPPSSPCISLVKEELTEDIETLLTESSYSPLNSPINSAAATLATSTAAEVGALNHSMMDTKPFLADIKHGPFLSGHSCPECYPSRTATPANTPDSNYCSPLSNICHDQLHIRMSTQHDLTEPPINVSRCYGNSIHNHHIRSPSGTAECVVSSTTLAVLSSSILNPTVSSDIHESILDWLKQDITSVNHYVTPQHVSTMTSSSSMVADFEYNSSNNNNQLRNSIQPMALSTLNDIIQREEAINNI
jgi:hypothetical protein